MAWILVLVFVAKNVTVNLKMRIPFYLSVLLCIVCVCVCARARARTCGFYALLVDLFACNEVHSIRHTPRIFKLELIII